MIESLTNISAVSVSKQLPERAYLELITLQKVTTIDIAATAPTVTQVNKVIGEPTTLKIICAVLRLFNDSLNTSLAMSDRQLFEYATIWADEFPQDTVKDLVLCLKRAKAGRYGPIYNRVDGSVISTFFRAYLEEKAAWGEAQNQAYISQRVQIS